MNPGRQAELRAAPGVEAGAGGSVEPRGGEPVRWGLASAMMLKQGNGFRGKWMGTQTPSGNGNFLCSDFNTLPFTP